LFIITSHGIIPKNQALYRTLEARVIIMDNGQQYLFLIKKKEQKAISMDIKDLASKDINKKQYKYISNNLSSSLSCLIILFFVIQMKMSKEGRMINTKVFRLESSDRTQVQVGIIEQFKNEDSLLFTWESSLMMSAYIMNHKHLFANAHILEIGAGNIHSICYMSVCHAGNARQC
jgi:hypothetical protein